MDNSSEARKERRTRNGARLTQGPIGRTLLRLTLPMMAGMLGMMIFNIVDTFFVSQLGTTELAAISFTFPVVMMIGGISLGMSMGVSALVSKAIGTGDRKSVSRLVTDGILLSLLISVLVVVVGVSTMPQVFSAMGAGPGTLPLVMHYMFIWYLGAFFVVIPMTGNSAIRATGDTKTPAIIMLAAGITNAILDPLFIFGIGPFPALGIQGAAVATVISRFMTMMLALSILHYREKMISFTIPSFGKVVQSWRAIAYIGIPSAIIRVTVPLAIGVLTSIVAAYGTEAVAAFGVSSRIEFFSMVFLFSLSAVMSPFVGQNFGAGKEFRLIRGIRFAEKFSLAWGLGMFALLALAGRFLVMPFSSDPAVLPVATMYLMIVPISYGMQGIIISLTTSMGVLNKPLHSAALVMIQMMVLVIPLALLGSAFFGLQGVFAGMALGHCTAGLMAHLAFPRITGLGRKQPNR